MKKLWGIIAIGAFTTVLLPLGNARPQYAKDTGKKCVDCHVNGNPKELTEMGKYYRDHNHSLKGYKGPER